MQTNKINDGGPAFHSITCINGDNYNAPRLQYHRGMTLRDWFAGQALAGILANVHSDDGTGWTDGWDTPATRAYGAADAMLKARETDKS